MSSNYLKINTACLEKDLKEKIELSEPPGEVILSKSGLPVLRIDSILFHSSHDPMKEAVRSMESLKKDGGDRLFIFFGAGLGYSIQHALENTNVTVVWMECVSGIINLAFQFYDYSSYLKSNRLRILLHPFHEDTLYRSFKGMSAHITSFIPHRGSHQWKPDLYSECKMVCEKFFKKKDVNIATLSRFEKVWTKNIIQNLPELASMKPISLLFGIATGLPIVVSGAGPGLIGDIPELKKFREKYLLIAVDTALHVLSGHGIDPDLIYSVDPQTINKSYLEGYTGKGKIVFDPTSCYHTLRLEGEFTSGFFSSSPFPLIKLFSDYWSIELGDIPFGGSVSTNAVSLAEMMGSSSTILVGQDLAFTGGFAHCKGAILEERLNFKESRFFRREYHNFKQLFALPKLPVKDRSGNLLHTNEKMQIFRKWFSDRAKDHNWINSSKEGGVIENLPYQSLEDFFSNSEDTTESVKSVKLKIESILLSKENYFDQARFLQNIESVISDLSSFRNHLNTGVEYSNRLYKMILEKREGSGEFAKLLKKMDELDSLVSNKKGLNEIIGLGVQRIILMITEGYDTQLSLEEKKNSSLGIARKSILLYSGLAEAAENISIQLRKSKYRMESKF
ncbi:MAG: motility associated factor glycosyltransferase family protein [Leptospiraceae bacterium]|nr:motility associated factor glycosyltransferase family protein [Leptospiraceae bacterium]